MRVPKGHCFFKKLSKLNTTLSLILHYYSVGEGVKISENFADVINGWPQTEITKRIK